MSPAQFKKLQSPEDNLQASDSVSVNNRFHVTLNFDPEIAVRSSLLDASRAYYQ